MFSIYTVIPLIVFLVSSYLFNRKKLEQSLSYTMMISVFEGILTFLIVYLIFFEGFFSAIYQYFLFIILLAILSYVLFFIERDLDRDVDLQVETIKNNLVLFFITIAPFYVFLTVFRYQSVFLQILYSILIVFGLLFVYLFFRKWIDQTIKSLSSFVFDTTERALGMIGGGLLFIIIFFLLFNISMSGIKQELNLSDNISYFSYQDFPVRLENNFNHETEFKFTIDEEMDMEFIDYYVDEGMLYLYSDSNALYTIDIDSGLILHHQFLSGIYGSNSIEEDDLKQMFFIQNDQLYFLTPSTLYQVNAEEYVIVNLTADTNLDVFYQENQPYFLRLMDTGVYQIHHVEDNDVELVESVDLTTSGVYDELVVIDDILFYQNDAIYHQYYDDYSFARLDGHSIYDEKNHIMYTTVYDEVEQDTVYYQSSNETSVKEYALSNMQNMNGFSHDGNVYYVEPFENGLGRIDIMNKDFVFQGIHNHLLYQNFWIGHQYTKSSIINYVIIDDKPTYLQLDQTEDEMQFSLHLIEERPIGMNLPFYAHHGLWMLLPSVLALFFPLSDYRKHISFIGFKESLKKKS